jgi:Phosphoglycerate dehydrogenase and related dehydrogenases
MIVTIVEPIGLTAQEVSVFESQLAKQGHALEAHATRPSDDIELLNRIKNSHVVVVSNLAVGGEVIRKCANLKLINVAFTGTDHIDKAVCKELGITVCNAAGYSTNAVAELTISSAIALYRKMGEMEQNLLMGSDRKGFLGRELSRKTFGIVGFGAIGQRVAELALAFGCRVLFYNRSKKVMAGGKQVSLEVLLSESDVVSLHLPLSNDTVGLIDHERLRLMKPSAILINTARGGVVDIPALAKALTDGIISGAAIDVYEKEPPLAKNHPLFGAPNTLLLPHVGFATEEAIHIRAAIIMENVRSWLRGTPQNIVD